MKTATTLLCATSLCAVTLGPAAAQEKKPQAPAGAPQGMPPMPKPGPEHEVFKNDLGTWDATVESFMAPGQPPTASKGVETNTMGPGGFFLITDFQSEFGGMPFHGHGTAGYDPIKKKYVSTWIDSMSPGHNIGEASYEPATKTLTGWMEGLDPMEGKVVKSKMVSHWKDDNTRTFSMYKTLPDGKEVLMMRITYTRRK